MTVARPDMWFRLRPALVGACVSALLAASACAQTLTDKLEGVLGRAKLGKTKLSLAAVDSATGRTLISRDPDAEMIPASNMKLITTGAASLILGPEFVFKTELVHQPEAHRLVLRGSGDPALGDPKLLSQMGIGVEELIQHWVDAAKQTGEQAFDEVVIDDRVFDREYRHPTWPVGQANRWYCAEVSGFTFYTNLLAVFPQPQAAGSPAVLKTEPGAPWIELRNKTRSIRQGQQTIWAAWTGKDEITCFGDVRYSTDPVELALNDSGEFIARLIGDRLVRAGLKVGKARLAGENESLSGGKVIQVMQTPISTVLNRCNMNSYNLYAECLFKRMGREVSGGSGSFKTGAAVVRMALVDKLGPEAGRTIQVADGSGMSRENRVTASMLCRWLNALAADSKAGPLFVQSLPRPGEGTMENRFESKRFKNEVRAKSGYITGVCTLSGYVTDPASGRRVAFSILANDKPGSVSVSTIKAFHEDVVAIIDKWLTQQGESEDHGGR